MYIYNIYNIHTYIYVCICTVYSDIVPLHYI